MKIMCQEHYDKVVQYAESIDDKTLHECLKRLERRSNFTRTSHLIRSFSRSVIPMGVWALSADWSIMAARIGRIVLSTGRFMAG